MKRRMLSSMGWSLVSVPSEIVIDESSLPVDNDNDGQETTEDSLLSMVAKKGLTIVVCAIHSLAKPDR